MSHPLGHILGAKPRGISPHIIWGYVGTEICHLGSPNPTKASHSLGHKCLVNSLVTYWYIPPLPAVGRVGLYILASHTIVALARRASSDTAVQKHYCILLMQQSFAVIVNTYVCSYPRESTVSKLNERRTSQSSSSRVWSFLRYRQTFTLLAPCSLHLKTVLVVP